MAFAAAQNLVAFLKREAGEYLRSAAHYDTGDFDILYIRDDVDEQYSENELRGIFNLMRREKNAEDERLFELGNQHCTVRLFDGGLVFHFTQGNEVGTVVTLDPAAGRDMIQFVTQCLQELHYHSPQTIENAPTWLQDGSD